MNFGHKKLYIGGELIDATGGAQHSVICPGTETAIATLAWATSDDTQKTIVAAEKGFSLWSATSTENRADWMLRLRSKILEKSDLLQRSVVYEMGKTWDHAAEDLTSIADSLEYYAHEIKKRDTLQLADRQGTHTHQIIEQPVGVVVAFLAYNFPLLNLGFKLGPALAAGCSIIIKPSEYSPLSAYIIGEICHEIGFPAGVINIICGEVADVGLPLCKSNVPRLITMIGSTGTAQKLIEQSATSSLKRYSMECGGNAPFIVFPDADLDTAIAIGSALKTAHTGQICVAPNRFYIHEDVIEEFVAGMKAKFADVKVGFGSDEKPDMGPLANSRSVKRLETLVAQAVTENGSILHGGKSISGPGYFFEPTIILFSDNQANVLREEIFGPIAMLVPFSDKEEVLQLANDTDAGLASYVFSKNEDILNFFSEHLQFGEIQLNGVRYDINLPHGGIKNSGMGFDCSTLALDDYLIKKRVSQAMVTA